VELCSEFFCCLVVGFAIFRGCFNAALLRYHGRIHPTGFQLAAKLHEDSTTTLLKKGGTMIDYDDEDPAFRRRFEAELQKAGMRSDMPEVSYA